MVRVFVGVGVVRSGVGTLELPLVRVYKLAQRNMKGTRGGRPKGPHPSQPLSRPYRLRRHPEHFLKTYSQEDSYAHFLEMGYGYKKSRDATEAAAIYTPSS